MEIQSDSSLPNALRVQTGTGQRQWQSSQLLGKGTGEGQLNLARCQPRRFPVGGLGSVI